MISVQTLTRGVIREYCHTVTLFPQRMPTRAEDRVYVTFSAATRKWIRDNYRSQGFASESKCVASIVDQYVKSKAPAEPVDPDAEPKPVTPEEELDKITDDMGALNEQYDEKFEAIRSLIPKDVDPDVETPEDLIRLTQVIWKKLIEKGGFVRRGSKGVAVSRNDIKCYENLGNLHLRKKELLKNMATVEVQRPTQ